jgi:hypothetical protein
MIYAAKVQAVKEFAGSDHCAGLEDSRGLKYHHYYIEHSHQHQHRLHPV